MYKLLLITLGGGAGTAMRYLIGGWMQRFSGVSFPLGTFVVNVSGCFAIGLLNALFLGRLMIREEYRLAILVGILGGFTTFSSYAWETTSLVNNNQPWTALLNVALSNIVGLLAAWFAYRLGTWMFGVA